MEGGGALARTPAEALESAPLRAHLYTYLGRDWRELVSVGNLPSWSVRYRKQRSELCGMKRSKTQALRFALRWFLYDCVG